MRRRGRPGLGHAVKLDKPSPFIGRDALLAQREAGVRKRLVRFTFDDPAAFPWGGEPILMDGRYVGELTSAGYSRSLGRAVAFGYARSDAPLTDAAILAARYEVDIAGERLRGHTAAMTACRRSGRRCAIASSTAGVHGWL